MKYETEIFDIDGNLFVEQNDGKGSVKFFRRGKGEPALLEIPRFPDGISPWSAWSSQVQGLPTIVSARVHFR